MFSLSAPSLVALQQGFARAPEYTRSELLAAMTEGTQLLEREVKDDMPAVSGLTRASVFSDAFSTPAGVLGVVGSASVAAAAVELGTKPHMPPVAPLEAWVHEKLGIAGPQARGVAFAIARKIASRGTKGQHHFSGVLALQLGALTRLFEGAAQRVAAHLARDAQGGRA